MNPASPRQSLSRRSRHYYFVVFSVLFTAIVLAGFSRRLFLAVAVGAYDKPLIVNIHATFFFLWILLLLAQTWFALQGRMRSHRAVGNVGRWVIVPMLVLGTIVAWRDTVHDYYAGDGDAALSFFYGELADLVMFGGLAGAAMYLRHKPEVHKRWAVLGSLGLLGAAYGRIPELDGTYPFVFIGFVLSMALYDLAMKRKVTLATAAGAAFLLIVNFTEEPIGNSQTWLQIAHWLLGA